MNVKMRLPTLCLLLPLALSGCSALTALGDASQPLEIYELRTPEVPRSASRRAVELVVQAPAASGALATDRIMIRPAPLQAQYLPGVRWADTAPVMIQTLLVRGLTETGRFASVGRSPVGPISDFTVLGELTDFQAETVADGRASVIRVRLVLRLVRESDSRVVATRAFAVTENTASTDPDALAAAFDGATSQLLAEAVSWIVART
ncbi:ABC-type transport auxiliary lipoprotein family protein [Sedimentitalea sp. JM2-8]|uniref:ABC-type transport auxiliary lipoprotein family protein n=1 Tax=Sedimentitalea xiamensis TaxID=3050037 RepID=A0ABT7FHV1_9RHOB|nr:ABC-type transport auxiliary lipoprotein family protein [Sedimentitalea xiamensis]MDK3074693.1 ABC-type transport auxiliary lipoprotein family protein [Sedimentitalea xiamensis]